MMQPELLSRLERLAIHEPEVEKLMARVVELEAERDAYQGFYRTVIHEVGEAHLLDFIEKQGKSPLAAGWNMRNRILPAIHALAGKS